MASGAVINATGCTRARTAHVSFAWKLKLTWSCFCFVFFCFVCAGSGSTWLEESLAYGVVYNSSSTLNLPYDNANDDEQMVGIRFTNLNIPSLAIIQHAYVRFTTWTASYFPVTVRIWAERSGNSKSFTKAASGELTSKTRTLATVDWSIPNWEVEGASGVAQTTVDLAAIIQEIVLLPSWQVCCSL
jgi:hypothetical protein